MAVHYRRHNNNPCGFFRLYFVPWNPGLTESILFDGIRNRSGEEKTGEGQGHSGREARPGCFQAKSVPMAHLAVCILLYVSKSILKMAHLYNTDSLKLHDHQCLSCGLYELVAKS